jgi:hypothetical protein
MKTLNRFLLFVCILSSASLHAYADKMDLGTQDQVIARLERVLSQMDSKESEWTATNVRLANLLAERARLLFMAEVEANCNDCKGSSQDRKVAIHIYESILSRVQKEEKGTILFQLAHLHDMAGNEDKAAKLYQSILSAKPGTYSQEIVSRSHLGLADIYFAKNDNKKALSEYQTAFKDPKSEARGLTLYRIGWCQFNLGQLETSIHTLEHLLSSRDLLSRNSSAGLAYDSSFHADVARDLAAFYLRRQVKTADINKFKALLPQDHRKELMLYFATESDRLGQKKASYQIYEAYLNDTTLTKEERLSAFVHLTQTKYDMGDTTRANKDFAVAALNFKNTKCTDAKQCAETQKEMRRYVTELHRAKKARPTMDVLKAYTIYTQTFPEDYEMGMLGAQLASDMKQQPTAMIMYRQVGAADSGKYRESALLGEMEAAEHLADSKASIAERQAAYEHYLSVYPKGSKAFTVKYQLAQLYIERKDSAGAASAFRDLALDSSGSLDLRKKSADLALDSLVVLKRDQDIQNWSKDFAQALPKSAGEYRQIGRKAAMNQIVQTTNNEKSSSSDLQTALTNIQAVDLRGSTDKESITHFKDEAILAQKVGDKAILVSSLNSLLAIRSLTAEDREEILARKVGVYEEAFDFISAYRVANQMKFPKLKKADKELRLGTLADLANQNPRSHYKAALSAGLSGKQAAFVASRLVLLSGNPVREIRDEQALKQNQRLMEQTLLLVFAKTHNQRGLEPVMKESPLKRTAAVHFIEKQPFFAEQAAFDAKISRSQLRAENNSRLQKSINERIRLLTDAKAQLTKATHLNDYTVQVMALSTMARENERMAKDLLSLPLPKGLKKTEEAQYIGLLKGKARPFVMSEQVSQQKLNEFWQNANALQSLLREQEESLPEIRPYITRELMILAKLAPNDSVRSLLERSIQTATVSATDLTNAREAVRQDPKDVERLVKLKNLESKFGHPLMATYLETRLAQLQKGKI